MVVVLRWSDSEEDLRVSQMPAVPRAGDRIRFDPQEPTVVVDSVLWDFTESRVIVALRRPPTTGTLGGAWSI